MTTRPESHDVSEASRSAAAADVYDAIARNVHRFDLFEAMRRVENANLDKPRFGDALRPIDEPIRFAQEPSLIFAPSPLAAFERAEGKVPRLVQRVFGFMGPNGAMPTHVTEYARERQLYSNDPTLVRFLDTLLHRFGLFFYRAWARAHPEVGLDRPGDAPIVRHVGAWIGVIEPALRHRDALGDMPKLFFAGRLARSIRDADGLEAWLRLQFDVPVRVEQFQGHWMPLEREDRSRLQRDGQCALGRGAVLGRAVFDVQHKFRILIGSLAWPRFASLLPGSVALDQLRALVRQYVGFEFAWDLRLILRRDDVPRWNLAAGRDPRIGRLGRTAWLHGSPAFRRVRDADDLVMNVESIRTQPRTAAEAAGPHEDNDGSKAA